MHLILVGVLATLTRAADIKTQTIVAVSCPNEDKPYEVVVVASNSTCAEYYRCRHGQAIKHTCSRNFHFNPKTGRCDYRNNADCWLDSSELELCPRGSRKTYAVKGYCDVYYVCYRGNLNLRSCGDGQIYNEDLDRCASYGQCPPENGITFRGPKKPKTMRHF